MGNILLGVTGSITAYKAAEIANIFAKNKHKVNVILTAVATKLIAPLTFQTLAKRGGLRADLGR